MEHNCDVLLTYNISSNDDSKVYGAIKDSMISKGYADRFKHAESNKIIYPPNTSLLKKNQTPKSVVKDLEFCVNAHNALNRAITKFKYKFD